MESKARKYSNDVDGKGSSNPLKFLLEFHTYISNTSQHEHNKAMGKQWPFGFFVYIIPSKPRSLQWVSQASILTIVRKHLPESDRIESSSICRCHHGPIPNTFMHNLIISL
jgi:hypothetical protein